MRGTFGDGIAEHLMIPYARKIWTVEPAEMEFGWIGSRVPTPDVERIIAGAVGEDVEQVGATAHFWYPEAKAGSRRFHARSESASQNVQLGREVERIDLGERTVVFGDGERVAFDRMIYTLPLSQVAVARPDDVPPRVRDGVRRAALSGDLLRQPRRRPRRRLRQALGLLLRGRVSVPPALVPGKLHARERAGGQELDLDGDRLLRCDATRPRARHRRGTRGADGSRDPACRGPRRASSTRRRSSRRT